MFIFNFSSELMIVIVILNILPVSLFFIQESFQVLESVVYEEQENTNQGVKACLLFFLHRISEEFDWAEKWA